jgi:hypothetical protein
MKIIQLTAENIKRLVAVEIRPDGHLVQIAGKNGQGKTSVLDSIWWALAGAKHIQSAPIRKGASQARIKLDMGDIVVTRTFQRIPEKEGEGFTTKLEVVGKVKGSPQAMLDSLLDSLAFDPLAFARMDPKQQFETLRAFVPDVDFDEIAAHNSLDFASRKEKNKRAKEERILAAQITIPSNTPKERIDESALIAQLAAAGRQNGDLQMQVERRKQTAETIERHRSDAARSRKRAEELRRESEAAEQRAVELEAIATSAEELLAKAAPLPDPINTDDIQTQIAAAKQTNQLVARREEKAKHEALARFNEEEAQKLTDQIAKRDAAKLEAIEKAKLPIESLTFGDGVVLLSGLPFDQASDAEQLKASCALAMAGNPQLRVIRVRDGSLLDEESLALLAEMAKERDYQVWIERVGSGEVGFVLEDGHVMQRETAEVAQ